MRNSDASPVWRYVRMFQNISFLTAKFASMAWQGWYSITMDEKWPPESDFLSLKS